MNLSRDRNIIYPDSDGQPMYSIFFMILDREDRSRKRKLSYRSHHVLRGADERSRIKVDLSVILVQVARVPI